MQQTNPTSDKKQETKMIKDNSKHQKSYRRKAFTLVETIMYVAILGFMSASVSGLILLVQREKAIIADRVSVGEDLTNLVTSIRTDMYLGDAFTIGGDGSLTIDGTRNAITQVRYYLSSNQVFRQVNGGNAETVTKASTNVTTFAFTDISTPSAAGTFQLVVHLENFPIGTFRPIVELDNTSTISLKYL